VYQLRPNARALVIEPRGGLDILTALHHGASSVVALESNPLVVQAVREQADNCGATAYDDPRVVLVLEEARSYLRRSKERFDVVQLSLSDTYQPVISGAYSLSESYAYTVEAFLEYLNHLHEEGILVITRWVQSPPTEELRACALVAEALRRSGVGDPSQRVIAFRSWSTATILVKRTPFRSDEIVQLKEFCAGRNFDVIYYRGITAEETNRYNILRDTAHYETFHQVLSGNARQDLYKQYPYEVSPTTDDRPFFFHYFKWGQTPSILRGLGKTWQPFGGSGFLILVALLVLALLLSTALILLPLVLRSRATKLSAPISLRRAAGYLLYFACLGLGFLFVEMPLLQQFILFLGQPTYSFSLVLFSILLFSGLGSYVAGRFPLLRLLPVLVLVVLVYPFFLSRLFALAIGWSLPLRLVVATGSLGPLGFLLGQPMPGGIRLLEERAPQWIPWAWAVNGFASVISSIIAVMGAVSFGFSRILIAGAGVYLLAWAVIAALPSHSNAKTAT
jgi:predicted membrane-bound spermidine synthase